MVLDFGRARGRVRVPGYGLGVFGNGDGGRGGAAGGAGVGGSLCYMLKKYIGVCGWWLRTLLLKLCGLCHCDVRCVVCGVQMYRYFQSDCGGLAVQPFKRKLQLKRRVKVVISTGGSRSKRTV